MTAFAYFLSANPTLGWVGLSMLQIAATIGVIALAARCLARNDAATRHAFWRCALIGVLIGPWLSAIALQGQLSPSLLPSVVEQPRPSTESAPFAKSGAMKIETRSHEVKNEPISSSVGPIQIPSDSSLGTFRIDWLRRSAMCAAIIWALGSAWLSARLIWGAWLLARLRGSAKPIARFKNEGVIEELREALDVRTAPIVLEDDLVTKPFAAGVARPAIFLPKSLVERLDRDRLRDILIHEGAHVIHRDLWTGFLMRIAEILYWPNPFLPLLKRSIERAREEVCDNFVLKRGDRVRYARTLVDLASGETSVPGAFAAIGLFEPRWSLAERIHGLLDDSRSLETRPKRSTFLIALVGIAAIAFIVSGLRVSVAAPFDEPAKNAEKTQTNSEHKTVDYGDVSKAKEDELAGTVVNEDGKPLEGVLVDVFDWYPGNEVVTDSKGRFRVPLRKRDMSGKLVRNYEFDRDFPIEVRFTKDGLAPRIFFNQQSGIGGWRVVMDDDTYFEGRVLDSVGKPVPSALIRADRGPKRIRDQSWTQHVWTETRSGPDGSYRLRLEPDHYKIQVRVPGVGIANVTRPANAAGEEEPIKEYENGLVVRGGELPIAADEKKLLDIRLKPGIEFRAKVVDAVTGKPVKGFRLANRQFEGMEGVSDEQGILRVKDMFPGLYLFDNVGAPGYARWWSEQAHSRWARKDVLNDPRWLGWQLNDQDLDFDIAREMKEVLIEVEQGALIRGRVLDPDGKPVANVLVGAFLNNSVQWLFHNAYTDAEGRYETLLPAGNNQTYSLQAYEYTIRRGARKWGNGVTDPILTSPGQVIDDFDIHLTRPGSVRGRVVDADGNSVAGRKIYAIAADGSAAAGLSAKTDAKGVFELKNVRPCEQSIQFSPFFERIPADSSKIVFVEAGKAVEGVELIDKPEP